jgi:phosphoglycerol transferase MdoB-like AlkP superfamily enzyme
MNFEELQKNWQAQRPGAQVTINVEALLREVRRNQRSFGTTIFWRDAREVAACIFMTALFLTWGIQQREWSLDFLALCCLGVGIFFVADRVIQRRKQPAKNQSLQMCLEDSLREVRHQIWLLKNVFWWYLLPILVGIGTVVASKLWHQRHTELTALIGLAVFYVVFYGLVYWGVYWLNQRAFRKELEPRRLELEALLASLK